jgi:hypothetical protein
VWRQRFDLACEVLHALLEERRPLALGRTPAGLFRERERELLVGERDGNHLADYAERLTVLAPEGLFLSGDQQDRAESPAPLGERQAQADR